MIKFLSRLLMLSLVLYASTSKGQMVSFVDTVEYPCTLTLAPKPVDWERNWRRIPCKPVDVGCAVFDPTTGEIIRIDTDVQMMRTQHWPYIVKDTANCPHKKTNGVMVFRKKCTP